MLQQTVNKHKKNWHLMHFLDLSTYRTFAKLPPDSLLSTLFLARRKSYQSSVRSLPCT